MSNLTKRDLERYKRQIIIPNFGEVAQEKLKNSHVFIAGLGGLGSSVSYYLSTAGIGKLTIVDNDKIELSNLNRQILHFEKDIGKSKVKSAKKKLTQVNSDIDIVGVEKKITNENVLELLKNVNAIVDCLDNFDTRDLLNDAAIKLNIPFFHGACYGFEGRVSTIIPKITACLRCVFPKSPKNEKVPILGAIAGTVGTIQATEVVKYFAGIDPLLKNKLLVYDGEYLSYDIIKLKKNPKCIVCGGQ